MWIMEHGNYVIESDLDGCISSTDAYIDIKWIKDNVEFVNFSSSFLVWGILISLNILLMNLPLALKDEKKLDQLYILL